MKLRSQLLWLSCGLLLLPWLGYHYLLDMQQFLLRGQESAQQLAAQAVATLLQNRQELLQTAPERGEGKALYAWPTDQFMLLDGYGDDWDERITATHFASDDGSLQMQLRLAQREQQLFLLIRVDDRSRVYRHPGIGALDSSDHLRLAFRYQEQTRRYVIATEAVGAADLYPADAHWRLDGGASSLPLQANWQEQSGGYQVELMLPVGLLKEDARLWLAAVDVADPQQRRPVAQVTTGSNVGRSVHLHAPELQLLIAGLRQPGRHIRVLDRQGVVRAVSNLRSATPGLQTRAEQSVARALGGHSVIDRYRIGTQEQILVAEPIRDFSDAVAGVVMVEVATRDILDLQRSTLLKTAAVTAGVFGLLLLGLLLFSARLTQRIRRLGRDTRSSLDERGRVRRAGLPRDGGGDELAELGGDISTLLQRLFHYTRYLERMPRTLRHELSNPLNTIATSLQMLRDSPLAETEGRYIDSAERGVVRLSQILAALTEATSLEEALADERQQSVDLVQLLRRYVAERQLQFPHHRLRLDTALAQALCRGSELRLEQALDKLVDNAADFAPAGSELCFSLRAEGAGWRLALYNPGPPVPEELVASLFDALVTGRSGAAEGSPHLGIGLYVVQLIAAAHGGQVQARNRAAGVEVVLLLPQSD